MSKKNNNEMSVSNFNLQTLSTKKLMKHIMSTLSVGSNLGVFGRRGSGKTQIAKQMIKEAGFMEVYLNLSTMERVDLGGYPNFQKKTTDSFIDYLMPRFYQPMMEEEALNGKRGVVILLDEVDKADISLQAPLLELVQFKTINGRKLPNLHSVIMTGNLISEGGSRPSPPLLDRCEAYLVEADVQSWLEWAGKSGRIHPSVTAFIYDNPQFLMGTVDPDERYKDPSPRGWENASQLISKLEHEDPEVVIEKVSGSVGNEIGIRYQTYFNHYIAVSPVVKALLEDDPTAYKQFDKLQPSLQLVVAMTLCARITHIIESAVGGVNKYDVNTKTDKLKRELGGKSNEKGLSDQVKFNLAVDRVGKFLCYCAPEQAFISVRSQVTQQRGLEAKLFDSPSWDLLLEKIKASISV